MNPFSKIWFWLLILSIIGFILALVLYERYGQTRTGASTTPGWIWIIFVISFIFWLVALVLYVVDVAAYHRRMEIAEACGELPPSPPKKKIECPKKECVERRLVEYTEGRPCPDKSVTIMTEGAALPRGLVESSSQEAFSAGGLRPLSVLAPRTTVVSQ